MGRWKPTAQPNMELSELQHSIMCRECGFGNSHYQTNIHHLKWLCIQETSYTQNTNNFSNAKYVSEYIQLNKRTIWEIEWTGLEKTEVNIWWNSTYFTAAFPNRGSTTGTFRDRRGALETIFLKVGRLFRASLHQSFMMRRVETCSHLQNVTRRDGVSFLLARTVFYFSVSVAG